MAIKAVDLLYAKMGSLAAEYTSAIRLNYGATEFFLETTRGLFFFVKYFCTILYPFQRFQQAAQPVRILLEHPWMLSRRAHSELTLPLLTQDVGYQTHLTASTRLRSILARL